MAGRRGPGGPPSDKRAPNGSSLESLGRQIDAGGATVPNDDSLLKLGRAIDGKGGRGATRRSRKRRTTKIVAFTTGGLVLALVGVLAFGYVYGYFQFKKVLNKTFCDSQHIDVCQKELPGGSFNVLAIGSDSRAGLPPAIARVTGGGTVTGSRSDVVKVFHVDPSAGTISVVSFPRDTMTTLLANQNLYGSYNRLNVNYSSGPGLLARTMEADFGIRINHVVQVGFGGLAGAVNALGGVWMNFPYPALDDYSSLNIHRPGCQHLDGFMALAVARSRHYQYFKDGFWNQDGSSDFSRIDRQNQFLRALIDSAKGTLNPVQLNSFINALPQGVQIDDKFSYNEVLGLAATYRSFNPNNLAAYTFPTINGYSQSLGDVLYVDQPAAQQMLVKVFGQVGSPGGLMRPTSPPPNQLGETPQPPHVVVAVVHHPPPHHTTGSGKPKGPTTTTTTVPLHSESYFTFNPVACAAR